MNIYFDLDGTLIDVSARFYRIYCDLLGLFNCDKRLSKEQYWRLKRERCPEEEIVHRTCMDVDVGKYIDLRMKMIESPEYLKYDCPFSYTFKVIRKLKEEGNRLVVVSLRESLEKTKREVDQFGFRPFFDKVLVHNAAVVDKWKLKVDMVRSDSLFDVNNSVMVGDTEADFMAARGLGIPCFLVSSGIRTGEYLTSLNPGFVIENICELRV